MPDVVRHPPTHPLTVLSTASKTTPYSVPSTQYWDGFQARQNTNELVVKVNS